jgi:hypothetical protein
MTIYLYSSKNPLGKRISNGIFIRNTAKYTTSIFLIFADDDTEFKKNIKTKTLVEKNEP